MTFICLSACISYTYVRVCFPIMLCKTSTCRNHNRIQLARRHIEINNLKLARPVISGEHPEAMQTNAAAVASGGGSRTLLAMLVLLAVSAVGLRWRRFATDVEARCGTRALGKWRPVVASNSGSGRRIRGSCAKRSIVNR